MQGLRLSSPLQRQLSFPYRKYRTTHFRLLFRSHPHHTQEPGSHLPGSGSGRGKRCGPQWKPLVVLSSVPVPKCVRFTGRKGERGRGVAVRDKRGSVAPSCTRPATWVCAPPGMEPATCWWKRMLPPDGATPAAAEWKLCCWQARHLPGRCHFSEILDTSSAPCCGLSWRISPSPRA